MNKAIALGGGSEHTTEVVAVVSDRQGRIWWTNPRNPDVWVLPGGVLPANTAPRQALHRWGVSQEWGPGRKLGSWKVVLPLPRLLMAYHFEQSSMDAGVPLPVGLAPLNTDPVHLALASYAAGGRPLPDRLNLPSTAEHLAWLRAGEVSPDFAAGSGWFVADKMVMASTAAVEMARPCQVLRHVEALVASGDWSRARAALASAAADNNLDPASRLKCALRLEEIESVDGVLPHAWSQVSLSTGNGGRYLDVVLAHLGYAAWRRRRTQEADAYLRRALAVSEDSARRAAIRYALSSRAAGLLSASA